jgi:hypothetical protein
MKNEEFFQSPAGDWKNLIKTISYFLMLSVFSTAGK